MHCISFALEGHNIFHSFIFIIRQDACQVIKKFMARDEGEMRFTILALAKTASD